MKKGLIFFLILFALNTLVAQKDTEHWFAPMATKNLLFEDYKQALYFSTDSTTPFPVEIYSNNALIGTVTISKGSPKTFDIPTNVMVATTDPEKFTPIGKGLYTKGTKPYFANFRFGYIDGEILTSKGKSAIGKQFYAVTAPTLINLYDPLGLNFTTGILATEDNTTVTISGFNPGVQFTNGTTGLTNPTMTFTLNKGQSYIIEGNNLDPTHAGFTGAKIVSDKPISVTNGNFNGYFGPPFPPNNNFIYAAGIIMDQSVPIDQLGNEYILIKGNGTINMRTEDAWIVATENNTQVFVNNATIPIITLNAGQYYRVNEINNNSYINQGNGHYNMYIKTSKNVYVYQLLCGFPNPSANGYAFMYLPPLKSCSLSRKIDEIGMVDQFPTDSPNGINDDHNSIKLNILTETGAAITVNGVTPTTAQGPYPVTGNAGWVTYTVPNITGNVTVISTKAVVANIVGAENALGYTAYFAGSSPEITQIGIGNCIPGIKLEVDTGYDTYQWLLNGNPIAGAVSNTYTPTQPGVYTVRTTLGTCPPTTTPEYKVYKCTQETTIHETLCDGAKKIIVPQFTNSTQTVVPSTITISIPPTNGTAIVNPNGTIEYTPNFGFTGTDTIIYKFCGNDPDFTDCEQVTLILNISAGTIVNDATLRACFIQSKPATALFNLTTAAVTGQTGVIKQYYPSPTDAQNGTNEILNPTNYVAPNGVVYVKVSNANGCYKIAKITLIVLPTVYSNVLEDKIICMEDTTTLDAGPGFTAYQWSTGATTQSINNVTVGAYWVDLKTGECITRQTVKVYASEQPVISNIDISNNTVTINVIGGTPPYRYSMDNINWQDSNVFANVPRGNNTVFVKDAYDCDPIEVEIIVPNLINAITPNDDGINDVLDYSVLAGKKDLVFNIFDRYGYKVHQGDKSNRYRWNGTTVNGRKVPTGTYWYTITWQGNNKNKTQFKFSDWILVKNRE